MDTAIKFFEFFNTNHLYQDIICLIDSMVVDILMEVLRFLKEFLRLGEYLQDYQGAEENICEIRVHVKEFCLTKIESLLLHSDENISALSTELYDEYFNETYE